MFDEKKWTYLTKKYPDLAGRAYELYLRDKKKTANPTTYFMWAGKTEREAERRYKNGLSKYKEREKTKMELKQ